MKLSDAIEGYLLFIESAVSPETIKTERVILGQFLKWQNDCMAIEVTSENVRDYLKFHRGRSLSVHTIKRHHALLNTLFGWLASPDIALIEKNPVDLIKPPKLPQVKPKALSKETIKALLNAANDVKHKRQARALILFLVDTGARASELCGVKINDIDMRTGRVLVTGKGNKQRYIYMGKRALSAVWLYVKNERPDSMSVTEDYLFLTEDGYQLNRLCLRDIIKLCVKKPMHTQTLIPSDTQPQ